MPVRAGDYVLGTHDAELTRLGVQHRVWRETMLGAWRRAGLQPGWRAADVGAGPGYAALDLAEWVGPSGAVVAVERSPEFVRALAQEAERRGLDRIEVVEGDLMELEPIPPCDFAWCRWVASFVPVVPRLVEWLARSIRPGAPVVFHEYVDYGSWRFLPPRPALQEFVIETMASWRAAGGEPDVAPAVVRELRKQRFRIESIRPHVFASPPDGSAWRWPAGFVATGARRLRELGRVPEEWVERVLAELAAAEADAESIMITPMVVEIIARGP